MSDRLRILVADRIEMDALEPLRDERFELIEQNGLKPEELSAKLAEVDAVLVRSATRISREVLADTTRLRVIGRAGVGVDTIDVPAATEKGIAVLNAPAGNTTSAAELAFALLMALVRHLPQADQSMKAGKWDRKAFSGTELCGKTLGLVGAGRVGGEVAKYARAFGMKVLVHDPYLSDERAEQLRAEPAALEDLLSRADVISLHVPLTESTMGLIDSEKIGLMKSGALLVNAARGGVVNEEALVDALQQGRLAGAALDVFSAEPLPPDHPLRTAPNVILTPHLGASTKEAQKNVAREIAEGVRDALLKGDLSRAVNAPSIGGDEMQRLKPLLDLATRLGRIARALSHGPIDEIELRYAGERENVLQPLAAATMIGLLEAVVGSHAVNFVNALSLAQSRGKRLRRVRTGPLDGYGDYLEVTVNGSWGTRKVAGSLLGVDHPRLVRIGEHHVDVVPRGCLLVLRNNDVPGVIGRVGTILGEAGINIAEYHQARNETGAPGEALAAVRIDARLDKQLMTRLDEIPEVLEVKQVDLG